MTMATVTETETVDRAGAGVGAARTVSAGAVKAMRIALAIPVALLAFPLAGLAVVLIGMATALWPYGEREGNEDRFVPPRYGRSGQEKRN